MGVAVRPTFTRPSQLRACHTELIETLIPSCHKALDRTHAMPQRLDAIGERVTQTPRVL